MLVRQKIVPANSKNDNRLAVGILLVLETSAFEVDISGFGNCNFNLNILNPNADRLQVTADCF